MLFTSYRTFRARIVENLGKTVKRIKWWSNIFLLITSVSHNITSGTQTGEFKSSEKAWYWNIKKLQGGSEITASVKVKTLAWTKLRPHPHNAGGICKRRFHSKMASNVFRPHYAGGIWKRNSHRSFWICVWIKLGQGNHVIIVTPSFSKSCVFKMFSVHTKTKSRRFQIPPVWRAFSKTSVFVTD